MIENIYIQHVKNSLRIPQPITTIGMLFKLVAKLIANN